MRKHSEKSTEQPTNGIDREGEVEWYYAIDHSGRYETRHEAVGKAAIINRGRDDRRRDVTVWAIPSAVARSRS